jgi:hypothetical protein
MTAMFDVESGSAPADAPVTISALEYDVLWEHLGLGTMPLVLKVPSPGRSHAERAELVAGAWRRLTDRGLGQQRRVDGRLEHLLRLLDRPDREVDARFGLNRSVRWLAAAVDEQAVLATLDRRGLTLREAAASGLAREAVHALPNLPAGPGESVTLPSAQLDAAAAEANTAEQFERALYEHGVRARDASVLRTAVTDAKRQGQFGAAARDRWGKRHRANWVVGFFDTVGGRYLQVRRDSPAGPPWTTISPADNRLLARQVAELLDEVTAEA